MGRIRRLLSLVTLTFLTAVLFICVDYAFRVFLPVLNARILSLIVSSLIISFLTSTFNYSLENFFDREFFPKKYEQMRALENLTLNIQKTLNKESLLKTIMTEFKNYQIGFEKFAVFQRDSNSKFHIVCSFGLKENASQLIINDDSSIIKAMRMHNREILSTNNNSSEPDENKFILNELGLLGVDACLPYGREKLSGFFCLGGKCVTDYAVTGRNLFWLKKVIENTGSMLDSFRNEEYSQALTPYISERLAAEMRQEKDVSRSSLNGQMVWASIMLVDIRGFTSISETLKPQEIVKLLEEFRSLINPIVEMHDGIVDKYIGDSALIVFGLPVSRGISDPDLSAVECAGAILTAINNYNNSKNNNFRGKTIEVGIAISSGNVVAGNIGPGKRKEYTVIGSAVNLVARLENYAGKGEIVLSPSTFEHVEHRVKCNIIGEKKIKGLKGLVVIRRVVQILELNSLSMRKAA